MTGSPTAQRRRLGRVLRSLREQAGMTGEEAATAAERSASWLSRIESGQAALRSRELRDLLDHYGMNDPGVRAELERMASGGRQRGWWADYVEALDPSFARFVGFEAEATSIFTFEDHAIPGLLQSPLYIRSLFRLAVPRPAADVAEAGIEFRIRRQRLLQDGGRPEFTVILDETVLQRRVGGVEVVREQLAFLLDAIDRKLVEFLILPTTVERMPLHSFTILRFDGDSTVTHVDTLSGGVLEEGPPAIQIYETIFAYLRTISLDPAASRQVVQAMKEDLR